MCKDTMDTTNSKRIKLNDLRKTKTAASKLKWKPLRVSSKEEEAFGQDRTGDVKATIRKHIRRHQRRAQLAKLAKALIGAERNEKMESAYEDDDVACERRHHPGAMAPANTTQYLMGNVYDDTLDLQQVCAVSPSTSSSQLYDESLSPESVYTALDHDYDDCLAFQQRDFEDLCGLVW